MKHKKFIRYVGEPKFLSTLNQYVCNRMADKKYLSGSVVIKFSGDIWKINRYFKIRFYVPAGIIPRIGTGQGRKIWT